MTDQRRTAWLYYNGQPIQSVLMTDGMTERDIRQKMLADLETVPGVVCDQGELPCERIGKIYHGELKFFPH